MGWMDGMDGWSSMSDRGSGIKKEVQERGVMRAGVLIRGKHARGVRILRGSNES